MLPLNAFAVPVPRRLKGVVMLRPTSLWPYSSQVFKSWLTCLFFLPLNRGFCLGQN